MLSKKENELLTRVGPGMLMGDLVRQYWLPFLLSADLPVPDGPPLRVRLLGEDLIAFRDSAGRVGLLGNHCAHRGASLFFGRNEEEGLRCVYHGWKFDIEGRCVDMPNEPPESNFEHKIRHTAYPCRERGGVIWAYMGSLADPPELPRMEWSELPSEQVYLSLRIAETNFMQPIEGEFDSSHVMFLHGGLNALANVNTPSGAIRDRDRQPRFSAVDTDYGVLIGARFNADPGQYYWRIYPFLMPFYTLVNVNPARTSTPMFSGHAWVPMDDEHTICLCFSWNPVGPVPEEDLNQMRYGIDGLETLHPSVHIFHPPDARPYARYWPKLDKRNDYLIDYEGQRTQRFSGIPGLWTQDSGVQESMGPIFDRSKEHLGTADTGQIAIRRRMLSAARALRAQSVAPPGALDPAASWVRPTQIILPAGADWIDGTRDALRAGGPVRATVT